MEIVEQSEVNTEVQQDSTLGTFKDVQSLRTAYDNLRSEFTRKSQMLAELKKNSVSDKVDTPLKRIEKEDESNENNVDKTEKTSVGTMHFDSKNGVKSEKIDENIENSANGVEDNQQENQADEKLPFWQRKTWDTQIKEFFEQFPMDNNDKKQMAKILSEDKDLEYCESPLYIAYAKMMNNKNIDIEKLIQDDDFVNRMIEGNPKIKSKIINDYLSVLNKGRLSTPKVMAESNGYGIGSKQDRKPNNMNDAYNLVKKYFE